MIGDASRAVWRFWSMVWRCSTSVGMVLCFLFESQAAGVRVPREASSQCRSFMWRQSQGFIFKLSSHYFQFLKVLISSFQSQFGSGKVWVKIISWSFGFTWTATSWVKGFLAGSPEGKTWLPKSAREIDWDLSSISHFHLTCPTTSFLLHFTMFTSEEILVDSIREHVLEFFKKSSDMLVFLWTSLKVEDRTCSESSHSPLSSDTMNNTNETNSSRLLHSFIHIRTWGWSV